MSTTLKNLYQTEVAFELSKPTDAVVTEIVSEKDIASLPEPVQRYFHHCGFVGKEKTMAAKVDWQEAFLKRSMQGKWSPMDCYQFNAVAEPVRIVYMKSKLAGVLLLEGRDKYQNGHGNMLIKLMNLFTLADAKGPEMDASALVTVLAETFLLPGYALQPYLSWTSMDSSAASATLTYNGISVSGSFYFNEAGEMIRFETNDRYFSEKDNRYQKLQWIVTAENYQMKNSIRRPTELTATWITAAGPYSYFKGMIEDITFNPQPQEIEAAHSIR